MNHLTAHIVGAAVGAVAFPLAVSCLYNPRGMRSKEVDEFFTLLYFSPFLGAVTGLVLGPLLLM